MQGEQAHPSSSSSSQWDGWWTSSWWDKSWQWKEPNHDCFQQERRLGVPRMIHQEVKIPTPHKPHFSSCARFFWLDSQQHVFVKTLALVFSPQKFRSQLCPFAAQTFLALCDWCIAVALRVATAAFGKKSRGVSIPR